MNQTLDVIHRRKSLRAYAPGSVSEDEKQAILTAAMRAPTAGNMMLYSIIEVADQAIKDRLVDTCDHQPFIAAAPLVLLFVADYQRWFDYYTLSSVREACAGSGRAYRTPGAGDLMLAACDTLIAAQNAVIAAESLGIGSCYIGDILENYEIHRPMFDLPRYALPVALLCFGRPLEARSERVTPRFDPRFVVFKDRYHRLDEAEFAEMYRPMNERLPANFQFMEGASNYGQHQYFKKFAAEFSFEMDRSVRAMIAAWQGEDGEA